ncbi:potassium channel protein [Rapidithrix thailandica]|uniref:Potassium channel protein n=1 Tax=Rapidithrix thailandica TaxID=413964 RepID=A0AAW9RXB4_9BACT
MKATLTRQLNQLFIAISVLLLSLLVGIIGFMQLEAYTFWDAFYMTVITISTVGMNELNRVGPEGRIFISIYIIFNFSVFAYFASVVTKYIFEGELRSVFQTYITNRGAYKMKDHTIVCGFGKNGSKTCEQLLRNQVPFTIIERDIEKVYLKYGEVSNVFYIEGDATSDEVLIEAGIQRAKTIITALPKDADNVFVTLTARELNPDIQIVARATEETAVNKLFRAGAHHVVQPDAIGGLHMANLVTRPEVVEFLEMLNGVDKTRLRLEELRFNELKQELRNKSLRELDIRSRTGVNVVGIKHSRDGFIINPKADTMFTEGDVLIVLGREDQINKFIHYCGKDISPSGE